MPSRLKDSLKSFFRLRSNDSEGQNSQVQLDILDGSWPNFEDWIRKTIGGDFRWGGSPFDRSYKRALLKNAKTSTTLTARNHRRLLMFLDAIIQGRENGYQACSDRWGGLQAALQIP